MIISYITWLLVNVSFTNLLCRSFGSVAPAISALWRSVSSMTTPVALLPRGVYQFLLNCVNLTVGMSTYNQSMLANSLLVYPIEVTRSCVCRIQPPLTCTTCFVYTTDNPNEMAGHMSVCVRPAVSLTTPNILGLKLFTTITV